MFTGLVEETGRVSSVMRKEGFVRLTVEARKVTEGTAVGDSIAVNGVCLTVTTINSHSFGVDVVNETLRRTNIRTIQPGDPVNLERAMQLNGRFGGHIVNGHIDGTVTIKSVEKDSEAMVYRFEAEENLLRYVIEKGSVALDGISLTVAGLFPDGFSVSVIPHTLGHTTLRHKKPGDILNMECDLVGKYIERLITFPTDAKSGRKGIDISFLEKYGFINDGKH
ncbi:MAG: riboflavin synthase [Bacteroidales bacterium]